MARTPSDRFHHPEHVPPAPMPSTASAPDGMERAREEARRYLLDAVRLLAAIAFAPTSEAGLHSKYLACKELVGIAGMIPQSVPAPPQHDGGGDRSAPS